MKDRERMQRGERERAKILNRYSLCILVTFNGQPRLSTIFLKMSLFTKPTRWWQQKVSPRYFVNLDQFLILDIFVTSVVKIHLKIELAHSKGAATLNIKMNRNFHYFYTRN